MKWNFLYQYLYTSPYFFWFVQYLFLWVNHERPSSSSSDQDSILCGDSVPRQSVSVPLSDLKWSSQYIDNTEIIWYWYTKFFAMFNPLIEQLKVHVFRNHDGHDVHCTHWNIYTNLFSVQACESTIVGHTSSSNENISSNIVDLIVEFLRKKKNINN